ncbi:uridylate kinase ura6 [Ramicandelaber brevisporus]|nr:uridylate kinase ura6 [Ramicandelaber brevisporus]
MLASSVRMTVIRRPALAALSAGRTLVSATLTRSNTLAHTATTRGYASSSSQNQQKPDEDEAAKQKLKGFFTWRTILGTAVVSGGLTYLLDSWARGEIAKEEVVEKKRAEDLKAADAKSEELKKEAELQKSAAERKPAFDPSKFVVVYVLGGPGAGKGTQCANLVKDYSFAHLSAGDLLREEMARPNSEYGSMIDTYIREGKIVPMYVTIALLRNAMQAAYDANGTTRFLIDGFPRKMDQALEFDETVCPGRAVLYFECPENEMLKRLLKRGMNSGRSDDDAKVIQKRFVTFRDTSYPVIEHYAALGKVQTVSCLGTMDDVYQNTKKAIEAII